MNREEQLNELIESFLSESKKDFEDFDENVKELTEIVILLKDKKVNIEDSKNRVFNTVFPEFKEYSNSLNSKVSFTALLLNFFMLLIDFSPVNNFEYIRESQIQKATCRTFIKIKFSSYLQSRQFLYNYIGNMALPFAQTLL